MFLQYALWGAWLPVTARYLSASVTEGGLGFSGSQIGMILGLAGSIGAIAAPFIAGQIADRYFSTEKILAFLADEIRIIFLSRQTETNNIRTAFLAEYEY